MSETTKRAIAARIGSAGAYFVSAIMAIGAASPKPTMHSNTAFRELAIASADNAHPKEVRKIPDFHSKYRRKGENG